MASITDLPVELKEAIFAEVSSQDLVNLSKTCKSIRAVALPAIFRKIHFTWDANLSGSPPVAALLRCIRKNPIYGEFIKELHFQTRSFLSCYSPGSNNNFFLPMHTHPIMAQDWEMFADALQNGMFNGNGGNTDPILRERNLNAANAILISSCPRIELLHVDIELLVNNYQFPALLQRTLCPVQDQREKQSWFEKLVHVVVTCGAPGRERRYADRLQVSTDTFIMLFYLPAVKKLDLTLFPDLTISKGVQTGTFNQNIWPFPQAPMALNLTVLQLRRSPALPSTLDLLLVATPGLITLEYDCLLPSSQTPFCLRTLRQGLNHIRATLMYLSIRCEVFADEAIEVEALGTVFVNKLGALHDFPALITIETSLAILYGQVQEVNVPLLANLLPPNLQHLTINDDLWGFYAFVWEGLEVMEVLKAFLAGQRKTEAYWDETRERWEVTWVDDGEAGWKKATPYLKEFVLDMHRRGWSFYDFWDDPTQRISLQKACNEQGIKCAILYNREDDMA